MAAVAGVFLLVYAVYELVVNTPIPLVGAGLAQVAAMGFWLRWIPPAVFRVMSRSSQLVRIVPLGLAIVGIYVPASVAAGPARTGQFVASFTFDGTTLANGDYAWVGESGGLVWLLPCTADSTLTMTASGEVVEAAAVHAEAQGGTSPTLIEVIVGEANFGIDIRPC